MNTELQRICTSIKNQDNYATAEPVYLVQQQRRVYGERMEDLGREHVMWTNDDGEEYGPELSKELEDQVRAGHFPAGSHRRLTYVEIWEFVTACFTEDGAQEYIRANAHNLRNPRMYVDSGRHNREWECLREFLLNYVQDIDIRASTPAAGE